MFSLASSTMEDVEALASTDFANELAKEKLLYLYFQIRKISQDFWTTKSPRKTKLFFFSPASGKVNR